MEDEYRCKHGFYKTPPVNQRGVQVKKYKYLKYPPKFYTLLHTSN